MRLHRWGNLVAIGLIMLLISACSGQSSGSKGTESATNPFNLVIGTGASGGVYAIIGAGATDLINRKNSDIRAAAQAAAGGVENARLVGSKQVHIGFATADVLYNAYNGLGPFEGKPFKNIRAIFSNYDNVLHFLVPEESPIKSLKDLKGKTLSVGAAGSLPKSIVNNILDKYFGMQPGTDYKEQYLSTNQGLDAVKNRQVDALFIVLGLPAASVIEAMTTGKLRFVDIDKDVLEKAAKDFPYYSISTIGKNVYPTMKVDAVTIAVPTLLLTDETVPESVIYKVTKTLLEGTEELAKIHAVGKDFTLSNATRGITTPYHPGAAKYLKEKGVNVK